MALNLIDDAGIYKQSAKLGLVDDAGIFKPLVEKTKGPSLLKEGAKAVPYLGIKALQGLTQPFILEPLAALGIDTKKLVEDAAKYWKPDLGTIPDVGVGFEKGKPKLEKRRSDIADILGATAGGVGFVAGPARGAMTAGKALTNLPALEKAARPFYRNILAGMIGGALTGEGKVDETLQNAALFGVFEGLAALPKSIRDSNTWRKATIKERGLILQSLEDTMAKNPDMSEGELLRRYNNPVWYKEALSKRMMGEPVTGEPTGPIPGQSGQPFPQEIPPAPPGPPLAPTALTPKPQVIPLRPVSIKPAMNLFEKAGGPMIGEDFVEGTGEIKLPYPGQKRLGGITKLLPKPSIPGLPAPPIDIGPAGPGQWMPPGTRGKRPFPGREPIKMDQITKSSMDELTTPAPVVKGKAVKGETFRAWLKKQGGISEKDKMWGGEIRDLKKADRSGPLKWQVGVADKDGLLMEEVLERALQDPGWNTKIKNGNDVLQALRENPVRSDMVEDEVDNLWREEIKRLQDEKVDESEIEETIRTDTEEGRVDGAETPESEINQRIEDLGDWFDEQRKKESFQLTPEKGTPWERQAELEREGVVKRPVRLSKKAVFPTEGIKTVPGKQRGLFSPEKGENLDLFDEAKISSATTDKAKPLRAADKEAETQKVIEKGEGVAEGITKEPWEMTKDEYVDGHIRSPAMHKYGVEKALAEGKPVPPEVLKDYPELTKPKEAEAKTLKDETGEGVSGGEPKIFKGKNVDVVVSPSPKEPGKWQVSMIDKKGIPSGDTQYDTYDEAIREGKHEAGLTTPEEEQAYQDLLATKVEPRGAEEAVTPLQGAFSGRANAKEVDKLTSTAKKWKEESQDKAKETLSKLSEKELESMSVDSLDSLLADITMGPGNLQKMNWKKSDFIEVLVKKKLTLKPTKAKPEGKPLSFEAWKSTRPEGDKNLKEQYQDYLKKPKTPLSVSDTIEALYKETTTVPSAKKKKIIEIIKDQLKSEEGNIRLDTIIENLDTIKKIAKDANVDITNEDIKFLEEQIRLPYWRAKSDPDFARVYKVQETRETNRNIIRTTFLEDLLPALELKGKKATELGELLNRGDILKGELGDKELDKLSPEIKKGYLAVRDVLNYIWFEHLPQELKNLGYSKTEIEEYRRQLGRIKGYFPHMRKGRYNIKVKETPESKEILYREHFDDIALTLTNGILGKLIGGPKSYKAPIKLRKIRKEYPDATIIGPEENVRVPEELFFSIDPVAIEQIIKFASGKMEIEDPKAFEKALLQAMTEVIQSRGFMAHGIKRRGIPGYDKKHWKQALVEYISGYAGMITKLHAAKGFESAVRKIDRIETPGKARYASKYVHDVMRNQEQFDTTVDKFRGLMFYKYLGAVVKSATLNLTQNYIAGVPRLSVETKWGAAKITAEMEEAGRTVFKSLYDKDAKGKRLTPEELAGINAAKKKGIITDQWTEELMGYAVGGYDTVTRKISNIMKFMFSKSEIFNREVMYVVAFRIARTEKKLGFSKAMEFAENIVKDVHFVYGKGNLPSAVRGGKPATAARSAYTFRTYPHQLMSLHRWLLKEYGKDITTRKRVIPYSRTKGSYASVKGLLALMAFAGLSGIPFYKDLVALYQKMTGEDIEQAILDKAGRAKNVLLYGLPGLVGIDLSGSVSMELPSAISDLGGVVSQVPKDIIKTKEDVERKNYLKGVEDFPATPSVFKYLMKGVSGYTKGIRGRRGLKVLDEKGQPIKLNLLEAFLQSIGFQQVKVSEIHRKQSAEYRRSSYWNKMRANLIDVAINEYYEAESSGKLNKFPSPDLQEAITEFNTKKPHDIVEIMPQTLIQRIGQKKTKRQLYRKQAIK